MENIFVEFLPPWIETGLQPAFYDKESGTVLQQTARMYAKVNEVVATVNHQNEVINDFIDQFNALHDYVYDYFENLNVQAEIDNKLDEMYANGQLDLLFSKYVNDYVDATNLKIDTLEEKVNALNDLSPEVVSSTSAMTDQSKIYLNTSDGYWYYYNGTQFVQGGLYNSDATSSAIKWYLNDVASDGNNLHNPFTSVMGSLATADGAYSSSSTYWVTDYIPIDQAKMVVVGNYWRVGTLLYNNDLVNFYKVVFFDEDKVRNGAITTVSPYIQLNATNHPEYADIRYMRIQFAVSTIPYENRYEVKLSPCDATDNSNATGGQLTASKYTAIYNDGIATGTIESSRLANNLYIDNKYNMIKNGINPFNVTDFGYGTIETANGATTYNTSRLNTCKIIRIPGGTSIKLDNQWMMLAFAYSENGAYSGRFVANWTDAVYFPADTYARLIFKNDSLSTLTTVNEIKSLISNTSITRDTGNFVYSGNKVELEFKYSAVNTGLPTFGQDGASYDDNYITFNNSGYYKVYTMNGDLLKTSTALDQVATYAPHANSVCFGNERYEESDKYPLLYVNAYNNTTLPLGACYVYRLLDNMTTTLEQQIIIDFTSEPIWAGDGESVRPYGNFIVDTDNSKLYAYVMIDSLNVTRFFKFNLPKLSDGAIIHLSEEDIEDYFDIEWMYYMQGVTYYNNKIYASCGFSRDDCKLYAIDLINKRISSDIPLGGFVGEPETVLVYNNELYVSSTTTLFRLMF